MRHLDLLGKGLNRVAMYAFILLLSISFSTSAQQKVVGGVDADIKDYPWQVALTSSATGGGFCGGSIISDTWVLTAAHCVDGTSPSNLYIRVGASDAYAYSGDSYAVNQIIVHPDYSGNSNDFALVEVASPFVMSAFVAPIDLISPAEVEAGLQDEGVIATITGWGALASGGSSPSVLQVVTAPIVYNSTACGSTTDINGNAGEYSCSSLDTTMICAGDLVDGGEDACQGDSGGPLVVRNADDSDWLLIGATSWGYGCADVVYPGVWARVSHVLDWIETNADINSEYGCMDATACNYDAEAIYDDGSCAELDECGDCGGDGPAAGYDCDGNCISGETLVVTMEDSYGDGWNGNQLVVNGTVLSLEDGLSASEVICYDSLDSCIMVSCDGGSWQSEVAWTISDASGNVLLSGGAPYSGGYGDCGFVYGCTDSTALNYNADATIEDGSCEYPVYGCTDSTALNFNIEATEDDGSCTYPIDCSDLTYVTIVVEGGSFATEVSWSFEANEGGVGTYEACLEDGCYTFNMMDSWGDGWNGYTAVITTADGLELLNATIEDGSEGVANFSLNYEGECGPIYGCTDSTALNFNELANADDGSCEYPVYGCTDSTALNFNADAIEDDGSCTYPIDCGDLTPVMIEVGGGSWASEVSWDFEGNSGGAGSYEACLEDGCYTFNMYDSYGDGWNGNTAVITTAGGLELLNATIEDGSEGVANFSLNYEGECGPIYGCTDSTALNFNELANADDGSCEYPVYGCTDSTALNYNSEAVEDDGSCEYPIDCTGLTYITIEVGGGSWASEVSWDFEGNSGGTGSYEACLEDGCYTFNMYDSFGDGWNGNTAVIMTTDSVVLLTATIEDGSEGIANFSINYEGDCGPVYGCTDSLALNFDELANADDGSCEYPVSGCMDESALNYNPDAVTDDGSCEYLADCGGDNALLLSMHDSYGDGWNGNDFVIMQGDSIVDTFTMTEGSDENMAFCLEAGCYMVSVDGGYFQYEVSWELIDDNGDTLLAGGAPELLPLSVKSNCDFVYGCTDSTALNFNADATIDDGSCTYPVYGCTDSLALNYNEFATEDDGSCTYPIDCGDLTSVMIEVGGGSWMSEVSWELNGITGVTGSTEACLEDGCMIFNMYDSYGDGWNGNTVTIFAGADIVLTGTLESGSEGTLSFALNYDGECGPIYGCTDSTALNYDELANADDGSCIYPVVGCTDSTATNYNPEAVEDDGSCEYPMDCEGLTAVQIEVGGGFYDYEISWSIDELSGEAGSVETCLEDGCYIFNMEDSYGDGWNSAMVTITANGETLLNGTLEAGSSGSLFFAVNDDCGIIISGCTDPAATNYNAEATEDDGSCEYASNCDAYTVYMNMDDTYGDGWNGNTYAISDASGNVVAEGELADGSSATDELCLSQGCYTIAVGGGSWVSEISWTLTLLSDDIMEVIAQGAAQEDTVNFGIYSDCDIPSEDVYGCMDNTALNYNELATIDDGSCEYDNILLPDWNVIITGSNHTMVVDGEATVDIDGMAIENGDAIGVFFTNSNGDLQCGGYVMWTGATNSIAAQGDDATTDEIDGFTAGESFVWMIWDASEDVTYLADATYSEAMPNQGEFVINGISALAGLSSVPSVTEQVIDMPAGWSIFSTYILADDMDMMNMVSAITDDVVIVKDNAGLAYLPEWGFNGIGDLLVGQAYQIKLANPNTITVEGAYMAPEENPITLTAGWNMIGYLRLEGAAADLVLEDVVNNEDNLVIAKDYNGLAYLPEWGFNGIGDMVPGQGYQLKINNADVLQYLSNDASYRTSTVEVIQSNLSNYAKVAATDNNMTVIIEEAAWDVIPAMGSEIAAFDKEGNMIGAAVYNSPVTVLALWGDDVMTSSKDGLAISEVASFKVWTKGSTASFEVTEWIEGSSAYQADAINLAGAITTAVELVDANITERVLVKVINVLGQEVVNVEEELFQGKVLFNVYDDGSVEKLVK